MPKTCHKHGQDAGVDCPYCTIERLMEALEKIANLRDCHDIPEKIKHVMANIAAHAIIDREAKEVL